MQVAQIILEQLGGHRFIVMTGAKQFVGAPDALSFSLPRGLAQNKANKVRITLGSDDLYTVEFFAIRGTTVKSLSRHESVYCDQLQLIFTKQTGLDTRL